MPGILGYWLVATGVGAPTVALILLFCLGRAANWSIRKIPGPSAPSWIFGNMTQLLLPKQYGDHEFNWQRSHGAVYRIKGCFGEDRLMLSDSGALQSIIGSTKFEHTPVFHNMVKLLSDEESLSVVKGERHRRLRAALNPRFSAAAVRQCEPTMQRAAQTITENLNAMLDTDSGQEIDMYPLLATATLTAISQAVLGCATVDAEMIKEFVRKNTRAAALTAGLTSTSILADAIGARLPEWVWDLATLLPLEAFSVLRRVRQLARRIGRRVVQEKKNAALHEGGNDVFTQLLNSERSDKMKRASLTEEDVIAQTSLFLIAGQEPAAHTLAFGLLELGRNLQLQDRLRGEVLSSGLAYTDMPLLNAFIKEILRLYPISPLMERVAVEDTIIPLAECITAVTGERVSQIPIRRGQIVNLAIASYQRLDSLWGPDAHEFKPSRWLGGAAYQGGGTVGPYANLLAFFGGPRTCLGSEFPATFASNTDEHRF
ncbi:cytochrome P450 [Roridomyces roridus]|uniref:Cytochrome P450 n=1 Tax=Roridomyces roridus TaxID=1738132 RepID=A0AAD7BZX3_9AGAR|nr:cytochrome P450 [Roridomyces roridus]